MIAFTLLLCVERECTKYYYINIIAVWNDIFADHSFSSGIKMYIYSCVVIIFCFFL